MAETITDPLLATPIIKTEPEEDFMEVTEHPIIKKEFPIKNGILEDSDCEDVTFFTQVEVDNTRKCLENTKLIIKDFETQLDWHLQQYMTLRNVFNNNKDNEDGSKRQDLLSISQLSALIANHPEGNKNFIKRKVPVSSGKGGKKKKTNESEEESDLSEEDSEFDEEDFDSEEEDDPGKKKKKGRKSKRVEVKDEIEEEYNELIEPKIEQESEDEDEEDEEEEDEKPAKKASAKRAKKPAAKGRAKKTAALEKISIKEELEDREEMLEAMKEMCIYSLDELLIDKEKPVAILKDDNVEHFDFSECKTSNVIITFETDEDLPEFVFKDEVANEILTGSIKLVQTNVFDQHLAAEEK